MSVHCILLETPLIPKSNLYLGQLYLLCYFWNLAPVLSNPTANSFGFGFQNIIKTIAVACWPHTLPPVLPISSPSTYQYPSLAQHPSFFPPGSCLSLQLYFPSLWTSHLKSQQFLTPHPTPRMPFYFILPFSPSSPLVIPVLVRAPQLPLIWITFSHPTKLSSVTFPRCSPSRLPPLSIPRARAWKSDCLGPTSGSTHLLWPGANYQTPPYPSFLSYKTEFLKKLF